MVAFTARHAFGRETKSDVYTAESASRIGVLLPTVWRQNSRPPFWTAIGLVELDSDVNVVDQTQSTDHPPVFAASMDSLLGCNVRRFGFPDTIGRVTATHGILHLTSPLDKSTTTYDDTVEIQFTGTRGLTKGDAGSLVLTESGEAVGLIVAGKLGACYVAPLEPLLKEYGLDLASGDASRWSSPDLIHAHNRRLIAQMREEEALNLGPQPVLKAA